MLQNLLQQNGKFIAIFEKYEKIRRIFLPP
jgi:hypothetical protein